MFHTKNQVFIKVIILVLTLFYSELIFYIPSTFAATNIGTSITTDGNVQAGNGSLVLLGAQADPDPVGINGAIYYNTTNNKFRCYENSAWKDCITLLGSASLSSVVSAITSNIINNGDNAQRWNWQLTTADKAALTFGENVASTGGGEPKILRVVNMVGSTALPLLVENFGNGNSFRVNDIAGDSTPFLIDNDGNVGIGTTTFDPVNHEKLKVDAGVTTSSSIMSGYGQKNGPLYVEVKNTSATSAATSSFGAMADDGDPTTNYATMGITSSNFSDPSYTIAGPHDAFFFNVGDSSGTQGGNMIIGTTEPGMSVKFITGGGTSAANEQMRIDNLGNVGIGTTSPGSELDVKGTLRLSGATSGYVGLAPAADAGSTTYTLPSTDGTANQILSTNGSGILSWGDQTTSWIRDVPTTTISPTVAGDDVTTSGDIYTTGTGGITSAGLMVAEGGITANLGDLNLNATGAFNTNITTGGATGTVTIGNTSAGTISVISGSSLTLTGGAASTWGTSTGDITLQPGGSAATGLVNIGGIASATPDLLALDVKSVISGAGDPVLGVNGTMYYNGFSNKFRCYVNGSWSDCDTTGGTVSMQSAYNNGATITTAGGTDLALTLTSGNFTASGTGAVLLTPTGASSFTSGSALTLTGGSASTWSTSSGALTITSATAATWGTSAGDLSLQVGGSGATGNVKIGAGGAGSATPDLLALDILAAGNPEPAGSNGNMYYSNVTNSFRCYEAGGWKDCGATTASSTTLQQAYVAGPTITTTGTTDLSLLLNSGNFTASGAGSVNLTPAGASSFTSGGALTLTGGATSLWSVTGAGNDLTIDAADVLNLGTTNATAMNIGHGGITTISEGTLQTGDADTAGNAKIADGSGNYITLTSPGIASDYTLTLPIDDGTTNQFLSTDGSGTLSWQDSPQPMTTEGDLIYFTAGTPTRLPIGASGTVLKSNGTDPAWTALTSSDVGLGNVTNTAQIAKSIGIAKGDLIVYSGSNTPTRLASGTNGQFLAVNTATTSGLQWVSNSIGADSLDFTDFSDTMTVDAATSINLAGLALTFDGGPLSINDNSNFTTNINTGTSTGTVNIGSGTGAKTINIGTSTAGTAINIGTNNTTADTITIGSELDAIQFNGHIRKTLTNSITATPSASCPGSAVQLTSDINIITVSLNNADCVMLPTAVAGMDLTIISLDTGQNHNIYPGLGASINALAVNAPYAATRLRQIRCIAISPTLWDCVESVR